jgi:uncharacterized protein (DUF1330 family)
MLPPVPGLRGRTARRRNRGLEDCLMPAYWIAHSTVTDAERYGEYARRAGVAIAAHGGKFLARGGRYVRLEGMDRPRHVLIEFPSVEAAEACYKSPAYQEALGFAKGASDRDVLIVEGAA